jgi:BirA family biotin operon repressor/biotin-[acetyl-CoA-carboxylase] ligase
VRLLTACESTNTVAAALPPDATADAGWALVAAERQSAGRGRMGRQWESPPGAGLLFSLLLDVPVGADPTVVGLLPLAAGVAVVDVCRTAGVPASLKWPNDIVVEPGPAADGAPLGKLGGLLAERSPRGVVVGVGLNVSLTAAEAPTREATSLWREGLGREVRRETLLAACATGIVQRWRGLLADGGRQALLVAYRERCVTLGRQVMVRSPGGRDSIGEAVDIDDDGHLLLRGRDGQVSVLAAGDVLQARVTDA